MVSELFFALWRSLHARRRARGDGSADLLRAGALCGAPFGLVEGNVAIVDGALFANNPSQDALQFGQKVRDAASVLLVSIGTGRSSLKHSFEEAWGWGVLGWMDPLLEIAFSDPAIDDVMRRTLEGRGDYFRLQVDLGGSPVDIDNSSPAALQRLEASTAAYLAKEEDAIGTVVSELSLPRAPQCGPAIGADYERPEGPREHPTP